MEPPVLKSCTMTLRKKPFKNIVGKGENAGNQYFLATFSLPSKTEIIILATVDLLSPNSFNLDQT